jgi:hypothetical protein
LQFFWWSVALLPIFAQDILKVGPQGWCFESRSAVGAFDADYLRLHSFYKKCWNEIIGSHFGFELHHCFGLSSIFGCLLPLYFLSGVLMDFGGDTSNHSATENSRSHGV